MISSAIITPWAEFPEDPIVGIGQGPKVMLDYPLNIEGEMILDITEQPDIVMTPTPNPNMFIVFSIRDEVNMELIRNNPEYFILWEEVL